MTSPRRSVDGTRERGKSRLRQGRKGKQKYFTRRGETATARTIVKTNTTNFLRTLAGRTPGNANKTQRGKKGGPDLRRKTAIQAVTSWVAKSFGGGKTRKDRSSERRS